jgi:hypothetical protein
MLQPGMLRVRVPVMSLKSSMYLILPAALWHQIDSDSNRNKYVLENISWGRGGGIKGCWRIRLISPPSVSLLSRQYGILDVSQPYTLPWFVRGLVLHYFISIPSNFTFYTVQIILLILLLDPVLIASYFLWSNDF